MLASFSFPQASLTGNIEIDHNFSKSHRIVTTSILPLVEKYGDHSRAVWEASRVDIVILIGK
jgi:hypothetical protein